MAEVLLINNVGRTMAKLTQREAFGSAVSGQDKAMNSSSQQLVSDRTIRDITCNSQLHELNSTYPTQRSRKSSTSKADDHADFFITIVRFAVV